MRRWGLLTCLVLVTVAPWSFTSPQRRAPVLRSVARRAEGYDYTPITWALDFTVPDEETQRATWQS